MKSDTRFLFGIPLTQGVLGIGELALTPTVYHTLHNSEYNLYSQTSVTKPTRPGRALAREIKAPIMRKHFRTRFFQVVLILVLLSGAFIFGNRKHWQVPTETTQEKVSESSASQDTFPAGEAPPPDARSDGQLPEARSFHVALVLGLASADQIPESIPPAARITDRNPTAEVEAEIERLTQGMDAFTAARHLNELEPGRGGDYGPYIRAFAAQAFAESPNDVEVVQFWARLQQIPAWQGSNPEAIAAYRALLDLQPDSPEALLGLSEALWTTEPESALIYLERAAKLTSDGRIVLTKAKAYQRMGDYDTALTLLKTYRDTEIIPLAEKWPIKSTGLLHINPSVHVHYYDSQIRLIEEGTPSVNPHPRYLEAPQGEKGAENVPAPSVEQHIAPTVDSADKTPVDEVLMPKTSLQDTGGGLTDAEMAEFKNFIRNMSDEQVAAFERFIRAENPELSEFLDVPVAPAAAGRPPIETSGTFSRERLRSAQALLKRYGAEEGFKRLRAQDPALAAQMERHLRRAASEETPSSDAPSDEE